MSSYSETIWLLDKSEKFLSDFSGELLVPSFSETRRVKIVLLYVF